MGILTKGKYTYGNLPYSTIITITGANIGDTVFDTTYNKLRSWDGSNFVHGHQVSQETIAPILDGYVMVVSSSSDNKVDFQRGTTDTEGIIGVGEDKKSGATGDIVPVTYHGDTRILITGAASVGTYVRNNTTTAGLASPTASAGVGTFGFMIGAAVGSGVNGLRRCFFKPVERA